MKHAFAAWFAGMTLLAVLFLLAGLSWHDRRVAARYDDEDLSWERSTAATATGKAAAVAARATAAAAKVTAAVARAAAAAAAAAATAAAATATDVDNLKQQASITVR